MELKHSERTGSSFAGSAKVSNATVPAISVKLFLTVITTASLIADISPEQVTGDTLRFTMNCTNATGGHVALNCDCYER